jgi:hypothetical protein
MFIYKGRIYRQKRAKRLCTGCAFFDIEDLNFGDDACTVLGEGEKCFNKIYNELFISRLFHAIIEVFYGVAKW